MAAPVRRPEGTRSDFHACWCCSCYYPQRRLACIITLKRLDHRCHVSWVRGRNGIGSSKMTSRRTEGPCLSVFSLVVVTARIYWWLRQRSKSYGRRVGGMSSAAELLVSDLR